METLLTILQWVIPSGGIGMAIGWLADRRVNNARASKEIHDTFKQMYEDVSTILINVQKNNEELCEENSRTRRALNRLSKAIEAIPLCDYHSQCPVLSELRIDKEGICNGHDRPAGKPGPDAKREACRTGGGTLIAPDAVGDRFPAPAGIIPDRKPSGNGHLKKECGRKRRSRTSDGGPAGSGGRDDNEDQDKV